jgi:hypothetical protein
MRAGSPVAVREFETKTAGGQRCSSMTIGRRSIRPASPDTVRKSWLNSSKKGAVAWSGFVADRCVQDHPSPFVSSRQKRLKLLEESAVHWWKGTVDW